jgi:hypothetical protein
MFYWEFNVCSPVRLIRQLPTQYTGPLSAHKTPCVYIAVIKTIRDIPGTLLRRIASTSRYHADCLQRGDLLPMKAGTSLVQRCMPICLLPAVHLAVLGLAMSIQALPSPVGIMHCLHSSRKPDLQGLQCCTSRIGRSYCANNSSIYPFRFRSVCRSNGRKPPAPYSIYNPAADQRFWPQVTTASDTPIPRRTTLRMDM